MGEKDNDASLFFVDSVQGFLSPMRLGWTEKHVTRLPLAHHYYVVAVRRSGTVGGRCYPRDENYPHPRQFPGRHVKIQKYESTDSDNLYAPYGPLNGLSILTPSASDIAEV